MDKAYELYCFADPLFYDAPIRIDRVDLEFPVATAEIAEGWERSELDDWVVCWPVGARLPDQGWKIHASSTLDSAKDVVEIVWDYCMARRIAFKFVRSLHHYFLRNGKYANRGASGKLVTIYPADVDQLQTILRELGALLDGRPGPAILSDLRWGDGPLYVRYGGFTERYCLDDNGEAELAIADPHGNLVPDRRGPTFEVPDWVSLPEFLVPHLQARDNVSLRHLPYRIDRALHFSNGGGLYHAVDERDGAEVVLKEARPHAGLDMDRVDAVERLRREREMLWRLSGLPAVPRLRDYFVVGGHHFLVRDYVEGTPLNNLIAQRYPLNLEEPGEAAIAEYTSWALEMIDGVEAAVAAIHERGVVVGDVHTSNMMVTDEGRVVLIDFEIACDAASPRPQSLADPGFIAPLGLLGVDADRYALACLRLAIFLPLTELFALEPGKAFDLAAEVTRLFPVPPELVDEAASFIATSSGVVPETARRRASKHPASALDSGSWPRLRDSLSGAILASATPERDDRLYPGDVQQFATGGLNLAYGAAGVLYALAQTGADVPEHHVDWLVSRATHPRQGTRLGLYDGLMGIAFAVDALGRHAEALKILSIAMEDIGGKWEQLGLDLYGGLSGMGLVIDHFAAVTGDPSLAEHGRRIAELAAARLGDVDAVAETSGGDHPYAGLVRGSSGPALLFLHRFRQTGDDALLDLAAVALRQDLRRCYLREDGSLEVNEGWRTMPYLADGSIGIGMVIDRYLAVRDDEELRAASERISRASRGQFYIQPSLFYGRAGMILFLAHGTPPGTARGDRHVAQHVRRLAWHALDYRGQLAFPGEQLMRLSMDLASGNAGVLLALGAAMHPEPVSLPFLGFPFDADATKGGETCHSTNCRG